MRTRALRLFAAASITLAALVVSWPAAAVNAKTEAAAKAAIDKAAQEVGGGKIDAAMKRLQTALAACGIDKCSAATKAALIRDSAAIEFKRGNREAGINGLVQAFGVDPSLEPNARYDVPEMKSEWEAAKDEAAATKGPSPKGDFAHTPATEQTVNTPLPVYVEYSGASKLVTVTVKYKGTGMREFKRLPLAKKKDGWAVTIPCGDVKRGGVRYYVEGFDQSGDIVASSGSPTQAFGVPIRTKISGSAPSLPGASAPKACTEGSSDSGGDGPTAGAVGAACGESSECKSGRCAEGVCADAEKKREASGDAPRFWIGVAGAIDFMSIPAASDVCLREQATGASLNGVYYCTNPDGTNFPGGPNENRTLTKGSSGQTDGGFGARNIRLMLTFDIRAGSNFLVGGRIGFVLNRYKGSDAIDLGHGLHTPIHIEGRLTYVFGDAPLATSGFAPYIFGGAGFTEFDAMSSVTVKTTLAPGGTDKEAWLTGGPWFVAGGGGLRFAFTPSAAMLLGLRVAGTPGPTGFLPVYAPELQLAYGF